ncbi:ATP-dependent RNA helicase HrpA [Gammaproteobacteria bacterium]
MPSLPRLADLDDCLIIDRPRLRRRLQGLMRWQGDDIARHDAIVELEQAIRGSRAIVEARQGHLTDPQFPPDLPISERLGEIADLIRRHPVILLCGETGSGKSTQLPKLCLTLGRGIFGRIGHTQPRRIAARTLSTRIAQELGQPLGNGVGYKVRFKDQVRPETRIKLMTDGVLLAEMQGDRRLHEYDTLILDEAHERNLNIDFLLGTLKQLLPQRPDLKIIVTSATIDPQRLSRHFNEAPIIEVSGRTYPVEIRYRPPPEEGGTGERDEAMQQALVAAVDELSALGRGDILVFLSGEREIREAAETLRKHKLPATEILPLYARLSPADQMRIFAPTGLRRIVLATNVAETSLTVPGIRYVIDGGFARLSRYSHRNKVQRLPVEFISKASAAQRAGRCGRVAAGVCIRLYSEESWAARADFTEPEILRTHLAAVILQMKTLGFGEIESFPFVDPPDPRLIKDGYRLLQEIGAVDGVREVTRLGREIARLPVDPRIARMLLAAARSHCLREMLVIAAALATQDPRERPLEKQQEADEAHALFRDEGSDFLGLIKLWTFLEEHRRHLSTRKFRGLCQQYFLSWQRVQEWHDTHAQLKAQLHESGLKENSLEADYESLHRALLSGLLSHIGTKQGAADRDYLGTRGLRFYPHPASGLFKKTPKWLMAAELVETTRLYARTLARIEPEWVEAVASHLVKRSYAEPHWEKRRGQVVAYERVSLFGLALVLGRRVHFGPIDPVQAREIFIRFALVEGDFETRAPFWRHNRELIEQVRDEEARTRRQDLLVDEETIYAFYDQRVPTGIVNAPQFEQWLRKASRESPRILHFKRSDLVRPEASVAGEGSYPATLAFGTLTLPLEYRFQPGEPADGVTLVVPLGLVNQIDEARCDWLVPGLREELILTHLRALPKSLRRPLVPIPDVAAECFRELNPCDQPLTQALTAFLKVRRGLYIPEDAWRPEELPPYLRLNLRILDEAGKILAEGRDLTALRREWGGQARQRFQDQHATAFERTGIRQWDMTVGPLPETLPLLRGGVQLVAYPALADEGSSVARRLLDTPGTAARATRGGLRRLFGIALGSEIKRLTQRIPHLHTLRLQYALVPSATGSLVGRDLADELILLALDLTFLEDRPLIRDAESFQSRLITHRDELPARLQEVMTLVSSLLGQFQLLRTGLNAPQPALWTDSLTDMRAQLERLVYQGFLLDLPFSRLRQLPRYLQGIHWRLDRLAHQGPRDRERMAEIASLHQDWWGRFSQARQEGREDERLEEVRWWFEELRVSLFAQGLGTAFPVSLKRLERRWRELGL